MENNHKIAKNLLQGAKVVLAAEPLNKKEAGYVQIGAFSKSLLGYFCGTCEAFSFEQGQEGTCSRISQPEVKTFGCCNLWTINPEPKSWIPARGKAAPKPAETPEKTQEPEPTPEETPEE